VSGVVVARSVEELDSTLENARRDERRIGFVPTMGALHAGHLSLVDIARSVADVVVVSIFVNPLQFGPSEDLSRYPRDEAGDLQRLEDRGVDVAFVPALAEMYPAEATTAIDPGPIGDLLEGEDRPGHFRGVCTVVAKLFGMVDPDVAVFGQKDAQQVAVVRRMVADLSFRTEIVVGPTIREPDGLALSSRNVYLSAAERQSALALYRALKAGRDALIDGADVAAKTMSEVLATTPGIKPGYASAVDPDSFGPPRPGRPVLLVVAARLGTTRLIDNMLVETHEERT
jgi:pantoate--beta-alanine ligase